MSGYQPGFFPLSHVKRGDRVRLRYRGYNIAKSYGETWGTVTVDSLNVRHWRHNTMVTVELDALEGAERRVRLEEISAVERDGKLIAERRQMPASARDQFPLIRITREETA